MAVINANLMAVYMLETASNTAIQVVQTTAAITATPAPASMANNEFCIVVNTTTGAYIGIGKKVNGNANLTDATTSLVLLAAATQSTIDASSSTSETVARDGAGASASYVVSGASTWNVSAEGLLDLVSGVGSGTKVLDAALAKLYVVTKFEAGPGVSYVGQGIIENAQISGGVDDMATYSATIKGYGSLYKGS
jgi:hypothetical protein